MLVNVLGVRPVWESEKAERLDRPNYQESRQSEHGCYQPALGW